MLYQTIAAHWPGFRERMEENGGLPKFVVSEFEDYLDCGRLEAGCLRLELLGEADDRAPKAVRHRWSWLLAHIFSADLERCPVCNDTMRWVEVAKTESSTRRLMAKAGLAPHPPPTRPASSGRLSFQSRDMVVRVLDASIGRSGWLQRIRISIWETPKTVRGLAANVCIPSAKCSVRCA